MDNLLKQKRELLGLSQSQFADKCGVSVRTLQEYEQGRKPLCAARSDVVLRFSEALGCDMADLFVESSCDNEEERLFLERLNRHYAYYQKLFELKAPPIFNTPFDDVFKTISADCTELLIPLINEAFNEHYDRKDIIRREANEHAFSADNGEISKIFSDSNFVIVSRNGVNTRYQVECQSTVDSSILLRIFEYSGAIAIEGAHITDNEIRITYPRSALIYLRHTKDTTDRMTIVLDTPGGEISWKVPVIKTQTYTLDDIFDKGLYMLLPYYILVFEKMLAEINSSPERIRSLKKEYELIAFRLRQAVKDGSMAEYENITIRNMCQRVFIYMTQKYTNIKKEVLPVMGGQILDYEAKDILNEGKIKGKKEGKKELLAELLKEGLIDEKTARKFGLE